MYPPVTALLCQPSLGKGPRGRGMRIATTSLRTGLAMTWLFTGGAGQGRFGRTEASAPTEGLQGMREKNPPVTALLCQPSLGKGPLKTRDADCHSSESITGSR